MSWLWLVALATAAPLDCETITPLVEANVPAETLAKTLVDTPFTPELRRCIEAAGADASMLAALDEALTVAPSSDAQPAAAPSSPPAGEPDTPTEQAAPTGRVEDGTPYVRAAYGITWLVLLGYVATLWTRRPRHGGST